LIDLLGKDAPSPSLNTRRQNVGTRRRGSTCTTPLGEAGTCQYIFSSQCSSILQIILAQGINQQVLAYLFQAIRNPCGFEGFDFTLCCADPNAPFQSTQPPVTSGPTPSPTTQPLSTSECGVSRTIQHPDWNSNTLDSDIAIVKLSRSVSYSRNIKPACLPDRYQGQDLASVLTNPAPVVVGWGSTSTGGGSSNKLRQANVPMVTQQRCSDAYSDISRVTIGDTKICAGDGTRDTCNGDSGGAMLASHIGNTCVCGRRHQFWRGLCPP